MHTRMQHFVGQVITWPTLSSNCVLVDSIDWNSVRRACANEALPAPPAFRAVVFEVLRNGDALAAYNGRLTADQFSNNPDLPVMWFRY